MKMQKNCAEIVEVMTYGAIDGPSTLRRSIRGNRRLKKDVAKERSGKSDQVWGFIRYQWTVISMMDNPTHNSLLK